MLEWHQLKLVGGVLIAAVPFGGRALPAQLAAIPAERIAGMLDDAHLLAQDVDRLTQHGLYADIDANGQIRLPSELSGAEVDVQLGHARRAVLAASLLPGRPWRSSGAGRVAGLVCRRLKVSDSGASSRARRSRLGSPAALPSTGT